MSYRADILDFDCTIKGPYNFDTFEEYVKNDFTVKESVDMIPKVGMFMDNKGHLYSLCKTLNDKNEKVISVYRDGNRISPNTFTEDDFYLNSIGWILFREILQMDGYFKQYDEDVVEEVLEYLHDNYGSLMTMNMKCRQSDKLNVFTEQMHHLFNLFDWCDAEIIHKLVNYACDKDENILYILENLREEGGCEFEFDGKLFYLYSEDELNESVEKEYYTEFLYDEVPEHLHRYLDEDKWWSENEESFRREPEEEFNNLTGQTTYLISS